VRTLGNAVLAFGGLFLAAGVFFRIYDEPLKYMPLSGLTPSSFAHFGSTLFIAAIALFAAHIAAKK
jgi:1,4-dihydroxy-2-naphthoate octaprenyltransferase